MQIHQGWVLASTSQDNGTKLNCDGPLGGVGSQWWDQTQIPELPAHPFILCRHGFAEEKRKEETDSHKDVLNDGAKLILKILFKCVDF